MGHYIVTTYRSVFLLRIQSKHLKELQTQMPSRHFCRQIRRLDPNAQRLAELQSPECTYVAVALRLKMH